MALPRSSAEMRIFFAFAGTMLWLGIAHTGFELTSPLIYFPATFFAFAAITGLCPGIIISKWIVRRFKGTLSR